MDQLPAVEKSYINLHVTARGDIYEKILAAPFVGQNTLISAVFEAKNIKLTQLEQRDILPNVRRRIALRVVGALQVPVQIDARRVVLGLCEPDAKDVRLDRLTIEEKVRKSSKKYKKVRKSSFKFLCSAT